MKFHKSGKPSYEDGLSLVPGAMVLIDCFTNDLLRTREIISLVSVAGSDSNLRRNFCRGTASVNALEILLLSRGAY